MSELSRIQQLWQTHLGRPFPRALAGEELDGEDLVLLDSTAAGCVSTFLDGGGAELLDAKRLEILDDCSQALSRITPRLPEEHRVYFDTLRELSARVVGYCRSYPKMQ